MRVTRAALRAGKAIHEDEDTTPSTTPPPAPKATVLQDITSKNILTGVAPETPKAFSHNNIDENALSPAIAYKTPKFDPELHREINETRGTAESEESSKEDSFVEHIIARTPAKVAPRIEDSLEAMDALEEAIEQVSQNLPVIEEMEIQSPTKLRRASPKTPLKVEKAKPAPKKTAPTPRKISPANATPAARKQPSTMKVAEVAPARPAKAAGGRLSIANRTNRPSPPVKPTVGQVTATKTHERRSLIVRTAPRPTTTTTMANPKPATTTATARSPIKPLPNTTQKRKTSASLSTSRPGFVPAKSNKAATTSTFVLPGEAIAAKLKAQREERQKREEEAEQLKKESKPKQKPVHLRAPKLAPLPRQTKTSQARLSMITGGNKESVSTATGAVSTTPQKISSLSVAKARAPGTTKPNTAIRRTTIIPSGTTIAPVAEKKLDAEELKARAKKAREEAAEKGRIASREWAEKQRKKALEIAAAKSGIVVEEKSTEKILA